MSTKIINANIFTGERFLENASIGIVDGKLNDDLSLDYKDVSDFNGDWLVPGFIDLQIYGGNGHLFSNELSVESLAATYEYSIAGGATTILPTVATNSKDVIFKAIETARSYQQQNLPGIYGLHLEGPFINSTKRGAHIEAHIIRPTLDLAKEIVNRAEGVVKVITLAPECCDDNIIGYFIDNNIIVSAGHSNANFAEANKAFKSGVQLVTHLFNAMNQLHHREPGLPAAAMLNENVRASIVADGHHVDFNMLSLAKKIMGERLFLITDAVTNAGGVYPHQLSGDKYVLPDGTLSGSALTMLKAVTNCIEHAGITKEEAIRMATSYPARAIGIDKSHGKIAHGYTADLIRLNKKMEIVTVIKAGS